MMKPYLLCLVLCAQAASAAPVLDVNCPFDLRVPRYTAYDAARARADVEKAIESPGTENLVLADALGRLADSYADGFDRATAAQLGERAIAVWSAATPTGELAEKLRSWGVRDSRNSRCAVAKPMLQASLAMFEKLYGPEDERTLRAMHDLLQVSISLADVEAVDALTARLLPALDKGGAIAGVDRRALQLRLALFYLRLEQFPKAETLARQGIALAHAAQPGDATQTDNLASVLASALFGQLRYDEGMAVLPKRFATPAPQDEHKRAELEIIAMARAGNLPGALAGAQQMLERDQAKLQTDQLAMSAAEARGDKAPQIDAARRVVIRDAVNVANMLDWLGELHQSQNDPEQAQRSYAEALDLLAQYPQIDPLQTSRVQFDLGMLYRVRGEPARALPLQQAALKTMLARLGPDHPDVVDAEGELARIHKSLNNYADAEPAHGTP